MTQITEHLLQAFGDFQCWAEKNEGMNAALLGAPAYLFPKPVAMGETGVKAEQPHSLYWLCYNLSGKGFVELVQPIGGGRMLIARWLQDEDGWGPIDLTTDDDRKREMRGDFTNNCIVQRNLCGYSPTRSDGVFVVGDKLTWRGQRLTISKATTVHDGGHRRAALRDFGEKR